MTMQTHEVVQGTSNWLTLRAKRFTASEAPAMLGLSKYMTRSELLRQKSTGVIHEFDAATQRRFNAGHESEAATRAWAETFIGQDLYPATGTAEVDGLPLLASFDGITMDESICWENKLWNEEFAAQVRECIAPDTHWPQMEHQMLVSGARKVLFTVSDGAENIVSMWYESVPERRARVLAGWKQFAEDLANYQPEEVKAAPVAAAIEALPALMVQVEGRVLSTNLDVFKESALKFIATINTNLQTDQDFADAEKTVKFCKDGEERLELVKSQALAQTASIDELFRAIDSISAELKAKRLQLDKLVKAEKENRKAEIITAAKQELVNHVMRLNERIGGTWMPVPSAQPFADSIKGLKSLDSMREKVGTALANAKIEANEVADMIEANRKMLLDAGRGLVLMPDFAAVCTKSNEDFKLLMESRIRAEDERLEAERARIQAEERAKAEREAAAKIEAERQEAVRLERERIFAEAKAKAEKDAAMFAAAEAVSTTPNTTPEGEPAMPAGAGPELAQPAAEPDHISHAGKMVEPAANETAIDDNSATMKLGDLSARLGFNITAEFLAGLGFPHIRQDKNAKLYRDADFLRICQAIANHVLSVASHERKAA